MYEDIYLIEIHHLLEQDEDKLADLHSYFYLNNKECCPICNEWLVQRAKPVLTKEG